jgi:hypothetical protein
MRHSAVLDKYLQLQIPDNIYNWIEGFFRDHSHCTRFGSDVSGFQKILASIIQGSALGPASYVVTAADLHAITPGNAMVKYVDDTYLHRMLHHAHQRLTTLKRGPLPTISNSTVKSPLK